MCESISERLTKIDLPGYSVSFEISACPLCISDGQSDGDDEFSFSELFSAICQPKLAIISASMPTDSESVELACPGSIKHRFIKIPTADTYTIVGTN